MKTHRHIPLHWLQAFEAAARRLSFTHAADELGLTQSAISQRIRLLEDYLGEPLFHRHGRRISLTEAANRFFPLVHDSFDRIERGVAMFPLESRPSTISLSSNISFWLCWLLPRVQRFLLHRPDCDLQISTTRWATDPKPAGVDLEILYGTGDWGRPSSRITRTIVFPVCSPSMAMRLREPDDLLRESRIVTYGEDSLWEEWSSSAGLRLDTLRTRYTVDLQLAAIELARQGMGIAMTNGILAYDLLAAGALSIPVRHSIPARLNYFIGTHPNLTVDREHSEFVDWIIKTLENDQVTIHDRVLI